MTAIKVNNLSKTYRVSARSEGIWGSIKGLVHRDPHYVEAVCGINFEIEEGELVAFIGPNGAGKTTTMKMLSGLLYPTGGAVNVFGFNPYNKDHDYLKKFAFVMGQRHQLWWELPALDTFRLNAAIFEISEERYKRRLEELDTLLQLDPLWHTPVKKLSLGQCMKMELACSLLHEPKLLLLDEPTLGLDVVMQKPLRDFIARVNEEKKTTVLLTSHNMEDIESLCKRVIVIHNGRILYDGQLTDMVSRFVPTKHVSADFSKVVAGEGLERFGELKAYRGDRAEWEVPRDKVSKNVGMMLKELPVSDLSVEEMPLEDVVRRIFFEGKV